MINLVNIYKKNYLDANRQEHETIIRKNLTTEFIREITNSDLKRGTDLDLNVLDNLVKKENFSEIALKAIKDLKKVQN